MKKDIIVYTQNVEKSIQEIESLGGRVPHILSDEVLVVHLPESVDQKSLKHSQIPEEKRLSATSKLLITAFKDSLKEEKKSSPKEGLSWDSKGHESPRNTHNTKELGKNDLRKKD